MSGPPVSPLDPRMSSSSFACSPKELRTDFMRIKNDLEFQIGRYQSRATCFDIILTEALAEVWMSKHVARDCPKPLMQKILSDCMWGSQEVNEVLVPLSGCRRSILHTKV